MAGSRTSTLRILSKLEMKTMNSTTAPVPAMTCHRRTMPRVASRCVVTEKKPFLLEKRQRFSRSLLWTIQRTYFERQGIEAWNRGAVPHYITSNPFIAAAYARFAAAWLRDWLAESHDASGYPWPAVDRRRPV